MSDLNTPLSILGGITAQTFLEEYWQKKPLLIRAGLVDFTVPLDADELAGMAMEEEVESRIVVENGLTPWEMRQGPFTEDTFATLPEKEWTLLVQAVDHWVPEVQSLKEQFQFLPSWRLDDVMISYATEGGSVGPHYDQYDVFLVQVAGKRRWQVLSPDQYQDSAIPNIQLHILDNFPVDPNMDWELEAGDILYLPPNFAHNGRALDSECMTYSIGFRAPSIQEALTGVRDKLCEVDNPKDRFAPPETAARQHSAHISKDDIANLQSQLARLINQPDMLAQWLGETMSESKYPEYLVPFNQQELDTAFEHALQGKTFIRPGDARICYYLLEDLESNNSVQIFCNGESLVVNADLAIFIQAICDQTEFDFSGLDLTQDPDLEPLLHFLLRQQGVIELVANEED
ncbi:50S ribosomal protein L16 arginine hydroxylase [Marinomonas spartinae]|uniref:50S ribosomal protein L16 arginine hydroxylase n=1 Tax=Marinomonas spartinae TaxID=1792290 RepID=A0A1A8T816_9GAMM|nr:cupin domain-containing protein [Marinomonas spartinae]SBS28767.1 50S ribosomal protein L16 arginine hydroxylase [Marinomonas spartinae]